MRPAAPGTQRTVLRTRHLAHERHGQDGVAAQLSFHKLPWKDGSRFQKSTWDLELPGTWVWGVLRNFSLSLNVNNQQLDES